MRYVVELIWQDLIMKHTCAALKGWQVNRRMHFQDGEGEVISALNTDDEMTIIRETWREVGFQEK